ncbi:DUF6037 family protein [Exiguobacterium oxidotolerans]|uniref:Uncharacterized protein n=1 Tax=Exiguobacterium oxidotolerans TaxID=223958 RepID=A0A653ICN4_9BACL|nr:DUF6037 family protein [Exiguobacterium oxidotolerans]VWX36710.1 conserved hypothetical protein [Exiguobacterium oxidotolerans]
MNVFENLKSLKSDMQRNGWIIDSFLFKYKNQNFVVLIKLYEESARKPEYALLKLEFLRNGKFSDSLDVPANSAGLLIDTKELRAYFNIEYSENLGDLLRQFNANLATFIPDTINEHKSISEIEAISNSLSKSDSDDPQKVYCYPVKRNSLKANGSFGERSIFNDNKARILREELYNKLNCKNEKHLSFCFSKFPKHEKTDEIIIYNWTNNRKVK